MKMKNRSKLRFQFLLAGIIALYSCNNPSNNSENTEELKDSASDIKEAQKENKNTNVFYSIPSPIQLGQLLQRAGAKYDKAMLNSPENVSKYSTHAGQALNLGVYGADMSYSAIFSQNQECMQFLESSKKLADGLGSSGAFASATINRLKNNSGSKDSMLTIISEIFLNSNESFKENEQGNSGLLGIAGGFVEGLYIGTQVAEKLKDNAGIVTRIAELKGSVNNIVALLGTQANDPEITAILTDLKEIKAIYDEMKMEASNTTVSSDAAKNVITIGGGSKYTLDKDQLERITAKIKILRTKITQV